MKIDVEDCMLWASALTTKGYAQVSIKNQITHGWSTAHLHRQLYLVEKGEIPDRYVLDHLCRNRSCINTDHLEAVTNTENLNRGNRPNVWGSHCNRGHLVTATSYRFAKKGSRICKQCVRENSVKDQG